MTMTELINEIIRIDKKYQRSILYRMDKDSVIKIYKKVKRKSCVKYGYKENV